MAIVDFDLSDREFERLRSLVQKYTAIELSDAKRQLVYSRFSRRLRELGLNSFDQYCDLVDDGSGLEIKELASAITTNFTRFFREIHHFEFLARQLAEWDARAPLRIWSAGCATGEEPYSIAITLFETLADAQERDIRILATDVDGKALEFASRGIFPADRVSDMDPVIRRRWFLKGRGELSNRVKIASKAKTLIHFKELNLIHDWPMRGSFDLIFCRNVMIYFGLEAKKALVRRFADAQNTGDYLVVGHAENLGKLSELYTPLGSTVYRRL